jgi:uncharacterized protein
VELTNRFSLPVPPEKAWDLLLDFRRMATAMPGATLIAVDGDRLQGTMLVKLGPMRIAYEGEAKVVERDEAGRRLLIEAAGKESRGTGTASVRIETRLDPTETGTQVTLHSSVNVTGRPAQMGAGLIQDVGQNLADEFARRLESDLGTESGSVEERAADEGVGSAKSTTSGTGDVLDVGSAAVLPVLRRLGPIVLAGVLVIGVVVLVWMVRR